jgi:hypothetical protein
MKTYLNPPGAVPQRPALRNSRLSYAGGAGNLTPSVRVPSSPRNWAYLRALRQAEMAAWNKPTGNARVPERSLSLVQSVAKVSGMDRAERLVYGLAAGVAGAAVIYGMGTSVQLTQNWGNFVQLIRHALGQG